MYIINCKELNSKSKSKLILVLGVSQDPYLIYSFFWVEFLITKKIGFCVKNKFIFFACYYKKVLVIVFLGVRSLNQLHYQSL